MNHIDIKKNLTNQTNKQKDHSSRLFLTEVVVCLREQVGLETYSDGSLDGEKK